MDLFSLIIKGLKGRKKSQSQQAATGNKLFQTQTQHTHTHRAKSTEKDSLQDKELRIYIFPLKAEGLSVWVGTG